MDNAARTRRRVLALFLPVAAVLYIGGEAVSPKGTDQLVTTTAVALKVLPIAAQHQTKLYLASALVLLGLGALAVSYGAIATLARDRGSALATVAALVGGFGAFCAVIVNVVAYPALADAATAPVAPGAAANPAGDGLQFRIRSCLHRRLLRQRICGAPAHGDRPVAEPGRSTLAGGPVLRRLASCRADGSFGPIVILYMLPFAAAMVCWPPHLVGRRRAAGSGPHPGAGQCGGLRICFSGSSLWPLCCEDKT